MNGDFAEYITFSDKKKSKKIPYDWQYICRRETTAVHWDFLRIANGQICSGLFASALTCFRRIAISFSLFSKG